MSKEENSKIENTDQLSVTQKVAEDIFSHSPRDEEESKKDRYSATYERNTQVYNPVNENKPAVVSTFARMNVAQPGKVDKS